MSLYSKCSDPVDSFKPRMVWLDWRSINVRVISHDLKKKKKILKLWVSVGTTSQLTPHFILLSTGGLQRLSAVSSLVSLPSNFVPVSSVSPTAVFRIGILTREDEQLNK